MRYFFRELIVAVIFLALLLALFNPWNIIMPTYIEMTILAALVVAFGAFIVFIWRERGGDEREQLHRFFSDRLAFLAGSGILLFFVAIGELQHQLDRGLLIALAVMVVAKAIGLIYTKIKL